MLYIVTVHYRSPRWIEIQHDYLRRHIQVPFQVWTSLEGIDPSYGRYFDRVLEQQGLHAAKLNHLAMEVTHVAADDDLLMFLDGDAFTIADPMPLIEEDLAQAPLLAVRRAENVDEPQPHPCFCVTTVGTWRSLPGDWTAGPTWTGAHGRPTSDVGANLLRKLELSHTPWVQVLRSNRPQPRPAALRRLRRGRLPPRGGVSGGRAEPGPPRPRAGSAGRAAAGAGEARGAPLRRPALAALGTLHERPPGAGVRARLQRDRGRRRRLAAGARVSDHVRERFGDRRA